MKRNCIGILSLAVLSLLLTTTGAYAQSMVEADVPFTFKAGTAELPAGHYQIKEDHIRELVTIRNVETGAIAVVPVQQYSPRDVSAKIVFHYVGNQHFLAEICGGVDSLDLTLPASKLERKLQTLEVASGPSKAGKEVTIALK